ncbi:anti-sigma factor [Frigoriglobus tundricola]|uniref:Anti-sigma K factor RskA C-terminal domain-containing protein n=1 Tax=Frigoriglobus tundricola TaxID=2774151 RepID=A0A6M5YH60_9BACT|nr:anti-sigma factor [Frigoriglobus tundricola]QJW92701.1 hypothetical protein FTUN_0198 [Frigoriglobus tundricola]
MTPDRSRDRLEELLATEATQPLTPAEESELDALLAAHPGADADGFELAAAAIHLALAGSPEPLPTALAEKLHRAAAKAAPLAATQTAPPRVARRTDRVAWSGWAVAAVLAWLLLYTNWPKPVQPVPDPTFAQQREVLLRDRSAKTARGEDAKTGISATVVWSTAKQEGFLEVRGLPPNDPTKEQYQLWIADPSQKHPVDGGVFDVQADGSVLVRVRNPIRVKEATGFVITKEVPGGVVVSAGPPLLVLNPKQG